MTWLQRVLIFALGFAAGFAALLALMLIYGDYSETPTVPVAVAAAPIAAAAITVAAEQPTPTPQSAPQQTGPTFQQVCKANTDNMTDPQVAAHAQQYIGQQFTDWHGWVYNVDSRVDGTYNLEIAMEERGLLWTRDIVIENIPNDLALRLNVEQPIALSGHVTKIDTTFRMMCNPLYVSDFSIVEHP